MRSRGLKYALALSCGLLAVAANAGTQEKAKGPWADADHVIYHPTKGAAKSILVNKAGSNLVNHGGPVLTSAKVVFIFWGPSFASGGADNSYATTLQAYRNQFGTTPEFNVITQYSGISLTNLGSGTADLFDTTTPPTNVTDAAVQGEVNKYLSTHAFDGSTIYEVVIPSSSYSSSGSSTSCGGPWPGCSGCSLAGWSNVQNQEHFVCHETREAVTDSDLNAWYDRRGNEADDKCAWSPSPFFGTGGYGYQYEWSNLLGACVKTR